MLIVEQQSNGRRIVKLHKDWNPSMISKGYIPKPKKPSIDVHMERIQRALLGGKK